ncbi:MAG TPA: hypothetical protein VF053_01205 [Streptosporangiales bacterium]
MTRGCALQPGCRPAPEQRAAIRGLDVASLSHDDLLVAVASVEPCRAVIDADQHPL